MTFGQSFPTGAPITANMSATLAAANENGAAVEAVSTSLTETFINVVDFGNVANAVAPNLYETLTEPQTNNLLVSTEDISVSPWTSNLTSTITPNAGVAPNGTFTADRLQTSTNGAGKFQGGRTLVANQVYTYSIYLKDNGGASKLARLAIGGGAFGGGADRSLVFDTSTGAFSSVAAEITAFSAVQDANGWWRAQLTFLCVAGGTTGAVIVYGHTGTCDFLVWGAQLEAGSVATPYVAAGAGFVSRAAHGLTASQAISAAVASYLMNTLTEPATTNLFTVTEGPNVWTTATSTFTQVHGVANAPNGTPTATTITTIAGPDQRAQRNITVPADNQSYVFSLHIRKETTPGKTVQLRFGFSGGANNGLLFNTFTGALVGGPPAVYGILDLGGWWRVWLGATNTGFTTMFHEVYPTAGGVDPGGATMDVWGPQTEIGNVPSPYFARAGNSQPRIAHGLLASTAIAAALKGTLGTVKNWLTCSDMTGASAGTPGILPAHWGWNSSVGGITFGVSDVGTEFGLPYIEVTMNGTPTISNFFQLLFEGGSAIPAAQGQIWTTSAGVRLVGGSTANISAFSLLINETNSSGAFLSGASTPFTLTSAMSRASSTRTLISATTAFTLSGLNMSLTAGQPINITFRIYAPQFEIGSAFTTFVPTTNGPASAALLGDPATKNFVKNSVMKGAAPGSPGTQPTGWNSVQLNGGLSYQILATGIGFNDMPFVRYRFFGTATGPFTEAIIPALNNDAPANPGETWTASIYAAHVAGTPPTNGYSIVIIPRDAAGTSLPSGATVSLGALSATPQRVSATVRNIPDATCTQVTFKLQMGGNLNDVVDFSVDVYAPQLEKNPTPSAWVPTGLEGTVAGSNNASALGDWMRGQTYDRTSTLSKMLADFTKTNLCTNFNAKPTALTNVTPAGDVNAVVSVVNDLATIQADPVLSVYFQQGLLNGNVYKIDNTAGTGNAWAIIGGNAGSIASGTISAFMRGGTGSIILEDFSANKGFVGSATYTRVSSVVPVNGPNRKLAVLAGAGQVVYFILNQLEVDGLTDPIVTAGATGSRTGTPLLATLASALAATGQLGQRTNSILDNSIGTTGWTYTNSFGLAWSKVGAGVEFGLSYVEVRIAGTALSTNFLNIETCTFGNIACVPGQTWTRSMWLRKTAGSFANINTLVISTAMKTAGGTYASELHSNPSILGMGNSDLGSRFVTTGNVPAGSAAFLTPLIQINFSAGAVIDLTFRIYNDQLERGDAATAPITTAGTAVSIGSAETLLSFLGSNAILRPDAIDTWTQSHVAVTKGQPDPNGGNSAFLVTADGVGLSFLNSPLILTPNDIMGRQVTRSVVAKAGTSNNLIFEVLGNGSILFNLSNGTVSGLAGGSPNVSRGMNSLGNGWYLCWATFTFPIGGMGGWYIDAYGFGLAGKSLYLFQPQVTLGSALLPYQGGSSLGNVANALLSRLQKMLGSRQTTNLMGFTQGGFVNWGHGTGLSFTEQAGIAPDGSNTATLVTTDASVSTWMNNGASATIAGATYTASIFVKNLTVASNRSFQVQVGDGPSLNCAYAQFNMDTGALIQVGANGSGVVQDWGSEDWGNGWFRFWVSGYIAGTNSTMLASRATNGQVSTYMIWGAQFEIGGTPSEYQARFGAASVPARAATNMAAATALVVQISAAMLNTPLAVITPTTSATLALALSLSETFAKMTVGSNAAMALSGSILQTLSKLGEALSAPLAITANLTQTTRKLSPLTWVRAGAQRFRRILFKARTPRGGTLSTEGGVSLMTEGGQNLVP